MQRVLLLCVFVFSVTLLSSADIVTVTLHGAVTGVHNAPNLSVGSSITGTYRYDASETSGISQSASYELLKFDLAVSSLQLQLRDGSGQVRVCDDCQSAASGSADSLMLTGMAGNLPIRSRELIEYGWYLTDNRGNTWSDASLPMFAPNLTGVNNEVVIRSVDRLGGEIWAIYGTIERVETVPEPSSLLLYGGGLAVLLSRIRRARR